jgi:hypothetical protein
MMVILELFRAAPKRSYGWRAQPSSRRQSIVRKLTVWRTNTEIASEGPIDDFHRAPGHPAHDRDGPEAEWGYE